MPSVSQVLNSFWNNVLCEQIQMISVHIIYSNKMIAPNDLKKFDVLVAQGRVWFLGTVHESTPMVRTVSP